MSVWQSARFFVVVPLVSHAMLWALFAVVTAGSVAIIADVSWAAHALTTMLLLQLFAAASGFRVPARRGHYDLLLTSGASRVGIALAHWLMSVFPGVLAWLALAVTERAAGGESLSTAGTLVAVAFTSTAPWALAMPLPRMSAAIFWLVVFFTIGAVFSDARPPGPAGLFPWALVGLAIDDVGRVSAAVLLLLASGCVVWAIVSICRMDFPLESGQ